MGFFTNESIYQGTSLPTRVARFFANTNVYQGTSNACMIDITPPTFAGISALTTESRGQLRASWLEGTDITDPVRYEVYISKNTSLGLFGENNIVAITDKLQYDIFFMPNGDLLENGATYHVGVRAFDGAGNRETNTVTLSLVSNGIMVAADVYEADGAFSIGTDNKLYGTLWVLKNSVLGYGIKAKYEIYDKEGNAVVGMSESNITPDSNGQFIISPVTSTLTKELSHYMVKVSILIDGAERTGYIKIIGEVPVYEVSGSFSLNNENKLTGTIWATANEEEITNLSRLGTASYQIYDKNGVAVIGMSETGIVNDANGFFKITPSVSSLSFDLNYYTVKVSVNVDGLPRRNFLPIMGSTPSYSVKSIVAIDSSNKLQGEFFIVTDDGRTKSGSTIGTASYEVFDHDGVSAGFSQSSIAADVDGRFKISPVLVASILDASHYAMKITVTVDGISRIFWTDILGYCHNYESKGQFSINALNNLEATLWAVKNGQIAKGSGLGNASYMVYDKDGIEVTDMNESGISADVNGLFHIAPKTAILLTDLTHFTVKISIHVDGVTRISYKGFTILGS